MPTLTDKMIRKQNFDEENLRKARMKMANNVLNAALAQYGLVKGQPVKRHKRTDPRTGRKFVAGRGGTGAPKKVLAEGQTVDPGRIGEEAGKSLGMVDMQSLNPAAFVPEDSPFNPDMMETMIRNLENATTEKLQQMANDLFMQPRSLERGFLAELMVKEILRRGIVDKSEIEKQVDGLKQKQAQQKEKEKATNANESRGKPD